MSFIFRSKKQTYSLEYSVVTFIAFYFTVYYMLFIYLHQIIVFFYKSFEHFFLKISCKRNSIRRRKRCSKSSSTFLFKSCSSKFKYIMSFFKTISAKSAKVSFDICLLSSVSKNLLREARPSPYCMLGQRGTIFIV